MLQIPRFVAGNYSNIVNAVRNGTVKYPSYVFVRDQQKLAFVDINNELKFIGGKQYVLHVQELPSVANGDVEVLYIYKNIVYIFDGKTYIPTYRDYTSKINALESRIYDLEDRMNNIGNNPGSGSGDGISTDSYDGLNNTPIKNHYGDEYNPICICDLQDGIHSIDGEYKIGGTMDTTFIASKNVLFLIESDDYYKYITKLDAKNICVYTVDLSTMDVSADDYFTQSWLYSQGFTTESYVNNAIAQVYQDLGGGSGTTGSITKLSQLENDMGYITREEIGETSHSHDNKELLDSYTQTDFDLADAVFKKHEHLNESVLATITQANIDEWNSKSEGSSSGGSLIVNVTRANNGSLAADATIEQINLAHNADKYIAAFYSNCIYPLVSISASNAIFENVTAGEQQDITCISLEFTSSGIVETTKTLSAEDIIEIKTYSELKTDSKTVLGAINELSTKGVGSSHEHEINDVIGLEDALEEIRIAANASGAFTITLTGTTDDYQVNKTFEEIRQAAENGKACILKSTNDIYFMSKNTAEYVGFTHVVWQEDYPYITGFNVYANNSVQLVQYGDIQRANDDLLTTKDKSIVGAINELNTGLNSHTHAVEDIDSLQETLESMIQSSGSVIQFITWGDDD